MISLDKFILVMVVIMAWNVRGIISSTPCLSTLLDRENCDIAIITEHKLKSEIKTYLDSVHSDFYSFVKIDDSDPVHGIGTTYSTGKGGVAIMCRKSLSFSIKEIPCPESNRIIGVELSDKKGCRWYIFGVYLPSDNNIDMYAQELTIVENIHHYYSAYGKVILGGDFNASLLDQHHTNQQKSKLLTKFVMNCGLSRQDSDFNAKGDNYTFTQKQTTLDYILFDKFILKNLQHYVIIKEGTISLTSDHLPVVATFNLQISRHHLHYSKTKLPAWHKATPESLAEYKTQVTNALARKTTQNLQNESDITDFFHEINDVLCKCAANSVVHTSYNPFTRPDWTKTVKELHDIERSKRRIWLSEGRPRGMNCSSYREYKRAKRLFRNALDKEHAAYMSKVYADIDNAAEIDLRLFWKLTKRIKPKTSRLYPEILDSTGKKNTDPEGAAEVFARHYETLYSCLTDQDFDDDAKNISIQKFQK